MAKKTKKKSSNPSKSKKITDDKKKKKGTRKKQRATEKSAPPTILSPRMGGRHSQKFTVAGSYALKDNVDITIKISGPNNIEQITQVVNETWSHEFEVNTDGQYTAIAYVEPGSSDSVDFVVQTPPGVDFDGDPVVLEQPIPGDSRDDNAKYKMVKAKGKYIYDKDVQFIVTLEEDLRPHDCPLDLELIGNAKMWKATFSNVLPGHYYVNAIFLLGTKIIRTSRAVHVK